MPATTLTRTRKEALRQLIADPDHAECREYQHVWKQHNSEPIRSPFHGYRQTVKCLRCGAEKIRMLRRVKDRLYLEYSFMKTYPKGYLAPDGFGRLTADDRAFLRMCSIETT